MLRRRLLRNLLGKLAISCSQSAASNRVSPRFTKHLKPSDISLSFLSGKGHLSNLELNGEVISEALHLPPWVVISRVLCDTIRARVPFTNINTDPVNFVSVAIRVCVCAVEALCEACADRELHGNILCMR